MGLFILAPDMRKTIYVYYILVISSKNNSIISLWLLRSNQIGGIDDIIGGMYVISEDIK